MQKIATTHRRGTYLRVATLATAMTLVVAACGSSRTTAPPTSTASAPTSSTAPATGATATGFQADGHPVYGDLGPENVPLETGPTLAPPNPDVDGRTVDGIGCNTTEQLAYHHHVHLIVFVDGVATSVPLGIGIMPQVTVERTTVGEFAVSSTHCFYWLHVHAADGIIHIESPKAATFTLGQAFAVWGEPLSATQVGPAKGTVTATVDGAAFSGDPADIPLTEHAQIVLNVGGPIVTPPPIDWSKTQL